MVTCQKVNVIFRIIPGLIAYLLLIGMTVLAMIDQFIFCIVLTLIFIFIVYYLGSLSIYFIISLLRWKREEKYDWQEMYEKYVEKEGKEVVPWNDVSIFVVIPNYNEHISILSDTLENIAKSKICKSHISIVLAMEEKEVEGEKKAQKLVQKYKEKFKDIIISLHPAGLEGEIACKGSNENWGVLTLEKYLTEKNINFDNVIVSISDADSIIHPKYFECLTYKFCLDQGIILNLKKIVT
jgi:cellulose synthase/poly-beta-1,6-N-acetylglucosamine synthase-like glycosyltransferase